MPDHSLEHRLRTACSQCGLRELCLPMGLSATELTELDEVISVRRRLPKGASLFRSGDRFEALHAVRHGFLKSSVLLEDGREQVVGFHMTGEIVGLDGVNGGYQVDVRALADSEVCVIRYEDFSAVANRFPTLQAQLTNVMRREIARDHRAIVMLGSFSASERLAAFLFSLSQRFRQRGLPALDFQLCMSRAEIGSYLGVKLETVSRGFSALQAQGVIAVEQKGVRILDLAELHRRGAYG